MFISSVELVELLDTVVSQHLENKFLVFESHWSFWSFKIDFGMEELGEGVLQSRASQLDVANYSIYYTLDL